MAIKNPATLAAADHRAIAALILRCGAQSAGRLITSWTAEIGSSERAADRPSPGDDAAYAALAAKIEHRLHAYQRGYNDGYAA
jgi:hypothetical protein